MNSRAGYVLAGGKSTRMGRDKALLPARGRTLLEIAVNAVREAAGEVFVVGGDRPLPAEIGFVPDLYPGEGPLGGILSALTSSRAEWNLLVACDMPGLQADFLIEMGDAASQCGGDALIAAGPSGRMEPLCAFYHIGCREPLQKAFDGGVRKVSTALEEVHVALWPVSEALYFQNINTPEEWAAYER